MAIGTPEMSEPIAFHVVVEPNPPLGTRSAALLVALIMLASFAAGLYFVGQGAWPVTVRVSASEPTVSTAPTVAVNPEGSSMPSRL